MMHAVVTSSVTLAPTGWHSVLASLGLIAGLLLFFRLLRWTRPDRLIRRWLGG
jgi:hypothetical protein